MFRFGNPSEVSDSFNVWEAILVTQKIKKAYFTFPQLTQIT